MKAKTLLLLLKNACEFNSDKTIYVSMDNELVPCTKISSHNDKIVIGTEKEVKENMDCCKTDNSVNQSIPYFDEEERCCAKSAFQDGAEFGYNKANEWHYVKDGDLPNTETKDYTYIRRRKRYERQFTDYRVIKCFVLCQNEKGKITAEVGYFDCNKKCFLNNAEGIVIAWKEIVLPELPKESK